MLATDTWSERACCLHMQSPLAPVNKLLLEIYETIDEADGIYAIARSHQAQMQVALFEHEGT